MSSPEWHFFTPVCSHVTLLYVQVQKYSCPVCEPLGRCNEPVLLFTPVCYLQSSLELLSDKWIFSGSLMLCWSCQEGHYLPACTIIQVSSVEVSKQHSLLTQMLIKFILYERRFSAQKSTASVVLHKRHQRPFIPLMLFMLEPSQTHGGGFV